jgi:hypothetical protein
MPIFHGLDEDGELPVICDKFSMSWRDGLAKEHDRTGTKSCLKRITFDHELPIERKKLQNRCHGQGVLERTKSIFDLLTPPEALLA